MNKIESEVIEIAIASIIANRTKASHGEPRQDIFGEDPTVKDFENDPVVKAAAEVAIKYLSRAYHNAYAAGVFDGDKARKDGNFNNIGSQTKLEMWLKENGLTPTEPETGKVIPTDGKVEATND